MIEQVTRQRPEVIYYPSIGMRPWSIMLCNLRLAPLQMATMGHPATTHSPEIDYMVMGSDMLGDPACFSERVVLLRSPGNVYTLRPDIDWPRPAISEQPAVLKVAVVAGVKKLNAKFLESCRRIFQQSRRRVEFHFFPNAFGIQYRVLCQRLKSLLAGARVKVYRRSDMNGYLRDLNECDVSLSPFPFGGENCTLDCLLQAIPVVTLEGRQVHGRLDRRVMRLAEMPAWLVTQNVQQYEEAALRLVQEDPLRCELARALEACDLKEKIRQEQTAYATDFVDTVEWTRRNHARLQQSDRQVWRVE